jgi:deoxyribodipyrimidine photo-lyase
VATARSGTALHWFRRDLRAADNTALHHAAATHEHVIGLFIINPKWFGVPEMMGPYQRAFWLESLRELAATLKGHGITLIVRKSADPLQEVLRVAKACAAQTITFNKDYEPAQRRTDERLLRAGRNADVAVLEFKDAVLLEEDELLTGSGGVYGVFGPYKRAWVKLVEKAPPQVLGLPRDGVSRADEKMMQLIAIPPSPALPQGDESLRRRYAVVPGEKAGQRLLREFVRKQIDTYAETRNFPADLMSTSRLSAHLAAGTISPRQVVEAILSHRAELAGEHAPRLNSVDTFLSEIIWRDFYKMILFHRPDTVDRPYQKNYSHITWSNDATKFERWCTGHTGYPIVDAAQRQMRLTGFMHNRLRMISSMFLTKDLDIHWIKGERFFMQWLLDYDQAANVGGWQWSASTGTDAAPYFRVMNPILQSERFDPDGAFIKQMCPELKHVSPEFIHAPWLMSPEHQRAAGCVIGKDYPEPIVDHATAKEHAIAKFRRRKS